MQPRPARRSLAAALRRTGPAAVLAGIAVAAAAAWPARGQHPAHDPSRPAPQPATAFEREMNAGMGRMMRDMHAPGFSGDADADFLAMMIPHHEGAVEMARLVLQHGRDPQTRRLAEDIIAGQTVEIESMVRRLALLRQAPRADHEFPALSGTRGP